VSVKLLFFVVLYVANNLLYTLYIKNKVIADVISIAIGFVLRILAGGAVIHVEVSHWLLICTFNVSLLLGFGKRRAELFHAKLVRSVNEIYTENKLDYMISVSAAVTLLSYMLYAVSPENITRFGGHYLVYTVPFVVYGIFRYVAKIQEGKCRDPIHLIYSDKVFVLNMLLWMMAISLILLNAYRQ
jgi:4-hydroxybenzoate polyprenyltransferase